MFFFAFPVPEGLQRLVEAAAGVLLQGRRERRQQEEEPLQGHLAV